MSRRQPAGFGGVVAALLLVAALASAPGAAGRRAEAAWQVRAAEAGAGPAGAAAGRRCRPARSGRAPRRGRALRHLRCTRIKRLSRGAPARERLTQVELGPRWPDGEDDPPAPAPGSGGDSGGGPTPLLRFVSVAAREWSLTLSRPLVGTGNVTIELQNDGEDPHNLIVSPDDASHTPLAAWAELLPGEYLRQPVTLSPGRYQLWCSLEGHEAAGMSVRLRVE